MLMSKFTIEDVGRLLLNKKVDIYDDIYTLQNTNNFGSISLRELHRYHKTMKILSRFDSTARKMLEELNVIFLPEKNITLMNELYYLFTKLFNEEFNIQCFMESDFGLVYYRHEIEYFTANECIELLNTKIKYLEEDYNYCEKSKIVITNNVTGETGPLNGHTEYIQTEKLENINRQIDNYKKQIQFILKKEKQRLES